MADYISRETAIEALCDDCRGDKCKIRDICTAIKKFRSIPPADVRPVVRASWEDATGYIYTQLAQRVHCPVCKSYAYFHAIMPRNYCPNCGADMGEGSK